MHIRKIDVIPLGIALYATVSLLVLAVNRETKSIV